MLWYTYLFENTMFTNKMRHGKFGKENVWEAGWVRKRVALIKSLIYARKKRHPWGVFVKDWAVNVSWKMYIHILNLVTSQYSKFITFVNILQIVSYHIFLSPLNSYLWIYLRINKSVFYLRKLTCMSNQFLCLSVNTSWLKLLVNHVKSSLDL